MPLPVSVIVPTFREAENLPHLMARIARVRTGPLRDLEVVVVDDDSNDGTARVIEELGCDWVRVMTRRGERGLSIAVIAGMREARGDIVLVMDADLSHPPEKIPELVAAIEGGADFALGSRYAPGGTTDAHWSVWRWLNSKAATLLARPFTRAADPMSGFFALKRATFEGAAPLNPLGYKIGLELMVKCRCRNVVEVPIHFTERTRGTSKLTVNQQWLYLRHVGRLLRWRLTHRA
jgi:dolichol-phosphate mannosyltransferase